MKPSLSHSFLQVSIIYQEQGKHVLDLADAVFVALDIGAITTNTL